MGMAEMDMKEKLVELLDDIQRCGEGYTDHEIYGMRLPDTVSNEDVADHLISNGVTVQEWISVKDRLPEKDVRVLVWMKDNEEGYTQMDTDRWSCTMEQGYHWVRWGKNVTHWMPLPQPPKEVE